MKKIMLSVCALGWLTAFAQEQTSNEAPAVEQAPQVESPWKRSGTISLLFNQAAFNHDWTGGGTNNYGGNLNLSYDANYKKDVWAWDNKLVVDYGLTRVDGDDFSKKTNDRFVINSLLGRQLSETWYFSFFANFQTQLDKDTLMERIIKEDKPVQKPPISWLQGTFLSVLVCFGKKVIT